MPAPEIGLIVKFDPAVGPVARRARPQLEQRGRFNLPDLDVFAIDAIANAAGRDATLRRRRHHALQHGGEPGHREASTSPTPRRGTRCASRGPARSSAARPCAATCTRRASPCSTAPSVDAAPPEQAHRLRRRAEPAGHAKRKSLATPLGMAVSGERRDALRRRVRLGKVGVFDTAALENDTLRARRRATTSRVSGGGPTRPRARRGARPPLRAHALRQRGLGGRHRDRAPRSRTCRCYNPEPADGRRRPAAPLRRALDLEQRRGVVRELPRLRRPRQPRLGPRQPRRRACRRT